MGVRIHYGGAAHIATQHDLDDLLARLAGMLNNDLSNLISAGALIVAGVATWVAIRANRRVGVYKRALWRIDWNVDDHIPLLQIENRGESPAADVTVVMDFDPQRAFLSAGPWPLISVGEKSNPFFVAVPGMADNRAYADILWVNFFKNPERRMATITWTDLEKRVRVQRIAFPESFPANRAAVDPPATASTE